MVYRPLVWKYSLSKSSFGMDRQCYQLPSTYSDKNNEPPTGMPQIS